MSERKRIYRDRDGVRRTMLWDDEDPDQVTVHTQQDVEPVLDSVERDRAIMAQQRPQQASGPHPGHDLRARGP